MFIFGKNVGAWTLSLPLVTEATLLSMFGNQGLLGATLKACYEQRTGIPKAVGGEDVDTAVSMTFRTMFLGQE
jgi:hypothetical protein